MFLGVKSVVWTVMLICAVIAIGYTALIDFLTYRKKGNPFTIQPMKYAAVILCLFLAVCATVLSKQQSFVGAPMIGLISGIIIVNLIPDKKMDSVFKEGTTFAGKRFLSLGIVCIGATLAVTDLFSAVFALPLVIFNMLLSFGAAYLIGHKVFHVSDNTCTLIGGGTCVCGGTAIAALSPIVKAKQEETAYAMTAIFLFDLLACLTYPYLAIKLGLSDVQFGFLAGTAINDTSSVVAAQETFASLKGLEGYALPATIKVVRTSMIIVLSVIFSIATVRKEAKTMESAVTAQKQNLGAIVWKTFPKFILAFIAMVALNTVLVNAIKETVFYAGYFKPFFTNGYKFFVTIALCAVGFKIKFKDLFTNGLKPVALGGCTWICLFISSLTFSLLFANKLF